MSWRAVESYRAAVCFAHLPDPALEGVDWVRRETIKGTPVTLVPHDHRHFELLRDRGLPVPHPIHTRYAWPGRFDPLDSQRDTAAFLSAHRKAFCLNGLGTGKTLASIWAMDYLLQEGAIRRALVVAPLSICDHVWERELFSTLPHRTARVLRGSRANKQKVARDPRVDIVVVNPESLHLLDGHLPEVDLIVVDEFTKFKNARSQRWKALRKLSRDTRLWLMSGTPAPQAPTDAYGPIALVREEKLAYLRWRDMTMEKISEFTWAPKPGAEDLIAQWMQPAVRYRRADCYDLPDVQVEKLEVDLTREQEEAIKSFQEEAAAQFEADGEVITAANAAAVLSKTLQVMGGGVYGENEDGKYIQRVAAGPFFEGIEEVVEQADTPVLCFTSFRSSAHAIRDHLAARGYRTGLIASGVPQSQRTELFDAVQNGTLDVLVAVAGTMSHGLTLTTARYVLWATPPYSYEEYEQANGRVVRRGQNNGVVVYHLVQNTLAKDLFRRLESKARIQDTVLNLIEGIKEA
ncbi:MAG: SNF2-related protein [Planctomycetota bacterium]